MQMSQGSTCQHRWSQKYRAERRRTAVPQHIWHYTCHLGTHACAVRGHRQGSGSLCEGFFLQWGGYSFHLFVCLKYFIKSSRILRTFLVVQWLRLPSPSAGGPDSIPGQETRSHMPWLRPGAAKKKKCVFNYLLKNSTFRKRSWHPVPSLHGK